MRRPETQINCDQARQHAHCRRRCAAQRAAPAPCCPRTAHPSACSLQKRHQPSQAQLGRDPPPCCSAPLSCPACRLCRARRRRCCSGCSPCAPAMPWAPAPAAAPAAAAWPLPCCTPRRTRATAWPTRRTSTQEAAEVAWRHSVRSRGSSKSAASSSRLAAVEKGGNQQQ